MHQLAGNGHSAVESSHRLPGRRYGETAMPAVWLGAASGLLVGLSFRWATGAPLALVALAPLLAAARAGTRAATFGGAATGVVAYTVVFAWLPDPLTRFQGLSQLWAWLILSAGVIYHALQFVCFSLGVRLLCRGLRVRDTRGRQWHADLRFVVGAAAVWTALDWGYPKVFPWSLGAALTPHAVLRQAADLGGVYGLSFIAVVVNTLVALAAARDRGTGRLDRRLFAAAAVVAMLGAYGLVRGSVMREGGSGIVVGLVQGAIPVQHADREGASQRGWATYAELTEQLLTVPSTTSPSVVVWPETTLPLALRLDPWYRPKAEQLVNGMRRPLIVGALDRPDEGAGEFNSAYAVLPPRRYSASPRLDRWQIYHKSTLVPFAEYVPGGNWLPLLRTWRTVGELTAGTGHQMLTLDVGAAAALPVRIAPSICVEGLQAGRFNMLVREGATLLLNLTDDGWLAGSAGPELHLRLTRLRAVETRRWLVRASNSGVSAVIDPSGEIVASIPFGERGTAAVEVVPMEGITPYVRFGDWIVWLSIAIVVILTAMVVVRGARASIPVDSTSTPSQSSLAGMG